MIVVKGAFSLRVYSMKVAKGYCRVSTQQQVDEHMSLFTQQKRIENYCEENGFELGRVYVDAAISGQKMDRPEFNKMIGGLKTGETIIVCELSRFSRNMKNAVETFAKFEEMGVNFISLNPPLDLSTPEGKALLKYGSILSQVEESLSEQVSSSMMALSAEGKLRSRPPFGWKFVSKGEDLAKVPEQQAVIEKIKRLYATKPSYTGIAKKLNEEGDNLVLEANKKTQKVKTPLFHAQTIKRILIDEGLVVDEKMQRPPLEQRIKSNYKQEVQTVQPIGSLVEGTY